MNILKRYISAILALSMPAAAIHADLGVKSGGGVIGVSNDKIAF